MLGNLPDNEITQLLQSHLITGMRRVAGFIPPVIAPDDVTKLTPPYSMPLPLVLVRNKPVFNMNAGHVDFCVDWLRELEMPCEPRVAVKKRKQKDGTWKEVLIYSNSIAEHVEKLRKYVAIIDSRFYQNKP